MPRVVDLEARRAELADAAARVIARSGLGGVSMRLVAAEAGTTTGALTHHFTDKRDLLRFTLETSLARRRVARAEAPDDDPESALRHTLANALPIDDDARRHWAVTVAFCAHAAGDDELAAIQRDAYRSFLERVRAQAARAGRAESAEWLIALVDGIALQALFDPERWPPDRQLDMIDHVLAPRGAHP